MTHKTSGSRRIYLDHAAGTPVAPEVLRAMHPYFSEKFGNSGSLHSFGQEAMAVIDASREKVAAAIGAEFREIIFTGSATESNNLALRGAVSSGVRHLIVSAVEHESVLETARALGRAGIRVTELPVDASGVVRLSVLKKALIASPAGEKILVSVMHGNNETGSIQPIAKIAQMVHEAGALFHSDASQTFQFLDCGVVALGADLITFSGHKMYGPKGIGVLYARSGVRLAPVLTGGGQEFGLRSGTENTALIAGLAAAVEYIEKDKDRHTRRIAGMKEILIRGLKKVHPKMKINGGRDGLPHILNVQLPGLSAQDALIQMDLAGIAISAGSACSARSSEPSHVLRAMGVSEKHSRESVRVGLGRTTDSGDIAAFLKVLRRISG